MGSGIFAVNLIQKNQARVAGQPGGVGQEVKDRPGLYRFYFGVRPGVDQVKFLVADNRLHEPVGDPHGQIEIRKLAFLDLGLDKVDDIGVIAAQKSHIGPASLSALDNHFGGFVEDGHEGNRAGSLAFGGSNEVPSGPQS